MHAALSLSCNSVRCRFLVTAVILLVLTPGSAYGRPLADEVPLSFHPVRDMLACRKAVFSGMTNQKACDMRC